MTPAAHAKAIEDAATDYARACSKVDVQGMTKEIIDAGLLNWEALQAAIRAGVHAQAVPQGWQLVPVEPTPQMLSAVVTSMDEFLIGDGAEQQYIDDWAAMLAAAPKPTDSAPL